MYGDGRDVSGLVIKELFDGLDKELAALKKKRLTLPRIQLFGTKPTWDEQAEPQQRVYPELKSQSR